MGLFDRFRAASAAFRAGGGAGSGMGTVMSSSNELRAMSIDDLARAIRDAGAGGQAYSGVNVSVTSAQRVAAVFAAGRILTDSVAQLPLGLLRRAKETRNPARDHPLYRLLHDRPNDWQTSFEWREQMQNHLVFRGNAYSYKVPGAGGIQALLPMMPDRMTVKQDPRTLDISYEYQTADGGFRQVLTADEVLHIRGPGDDGILGRNPIAVFRETIGDAIATQEHGSRFFKNGAKPLTVLERDPNVRIGEDQEKDLRADWASTYEGGENAHRTAILPQGFTVKAVGISPKDAQWIEGRKFQVTDIARIFRIPPHMLGDLERATFSNIEQQAIEFVTHSLNPWLVRWEQALNRDLLDNAPDLFFKFNTNALLRGDFKTRQEGLNIQRRAGVISANEWRALEDMNPRTDPGGDEYIVEQNMTLDDGQPEPEPTPQPQPAQPDPEEDTDP